MATILCPDCGVEHSYGPRYLGEMKIFNGDWREVYCLSALAEQRGASFRRGGKGKLSHDGSLWPNYIEFNH